MTTEIHYLGVSQLLIFVSCNVFKIVWVELLPTPLRIHASLLLGRLSIDCLLNTIPYSRLPYWCTYSGYPKYFVPFLKPRQVKAKLMACFLRSTGMPLQYISLLSISASALLLMLQRLGTICLMMYILPLFSIHSARTSNLSLSTSKFLLSPRGAGLAMCQVDDYSFLHFLIGAPRVCL